MIGTPRQYIRPGYTFGLPWNQLDMDPTHMGNSPHLTSESRALCVLRDEIRTGLWLVEILTPGTVNGRPTLALRADKVYDTMQGTTPIELHLEDGRLVEGSVERNSMVAHVVAFGAAVIGVDPSYVYATHRTLLLDERQYTEALAENTGRTLGTVVQVPFGININRARLAQDITDQDEEKRLLATEAAGQLLKSNDDMARHLTPRITDLDQIIASRATKALQDWYRRKAPSRPVRMIGRYARIAPRPHVALGMELDIAITASTPWLRPAPLISSQGDCTKLNRMRISQMECLTRVGPILKVGNRQQTVKVLVPNPHTLTKVPVCWFTIWKKHPKVGRHNGIYLAQISTSVRFHV